MAESESEEGVRLVMCYYVIDLGCFRGLDLDNIVVMS